MKNWKNLALAALAILTVVFLILFIGANNRAADLEKKHQEAQDGIAAMQKAKDEAEAKAVDSAKLLEAAEKERDSYKESAEQLEKENTSLAEQNKEVKETIQGLAQALGFDIGDATETVAETAEEVKETAENAASDTAETVADAVGEVKDTIETAVNDTAESIAETTEEVKETAENAVSDTVEAVAEKTDEMKDAVEGVVNDAAETVEESAEAVQENADEAAGPQVMTHDEYAAAAVDDPVVIETWVQATQSWWDGKITVYAQSPDGAYFLYNMKCSEEDAEKLAPGTAIRVKGYKAEWSGEIEVADGAEFEFIEGDPFIAEAEDVTEKLGTEELISCQNELVAFKGMTVEAYDETGAAFAYKNAENKTDDLYFKVSKDGQVYDFCVEFYLCGQDTEVYKAVEALNVGDVIDLEGFLYWYNGANPHITKVTKAE